jgi:competence ComEA-like helix-hairpin-helix protein
MQQYHYKTGSFIAPTVIAAIIALYCSGTHIYTTIKAAQPAPTPALCTGNRPNRLNIHLRLACGRGININKDNANALVIIPGIGRSLARRIIAYRKHNGPFRNINDLNNVKGIGPATVNRMAPWVEDVSESSD